MKILLFCISFFLVVSNSSCCKKVAGPIHTGRVLNAVCGSITVQFTDGAPYGQNGWVNPASSYSYGAPYDHVFKVANPCTWGGPSTGSVIHFRFVPVSVQDCALCKAFAPTPDTAYSIEVIPR